MNTEEKQMEQQERTRIVLSAVTDMFFSSKIESAARYAAMTLIQVWDAGALSDRLIADIPDLILFDLSDEAIRPLEVIGRIKNDIRFHATTIVGFCAHVDEDLRQAAERAGCDRVFPRSVFSKNLNQILQISRS